MAGEFQCFSNINQNFYPKCKLNIQIKQNVHENITNIKWNKNKMNSAIHTERYLCDLKEW